MQRAPILLRLPSAHEVLYLRAREESVMVDHRDSDSGEQPERREHREPLIVQVPTMLSLVQAQVRRESGQPEDAPGAAPSSAR